MTDRTLGIIYSLKNGINSADYKIAKYMAKECNYKASMYSRGEIDKILRTAIIDYIQTCDNPIKEIKRYFSLWDEIWNKNEYDVAISFLSLTQVRHNGKYVNGFRDHP